MNNSKNAHYPLVSHRGFYTAHNIHAHVATVAEPQPWMQDSAAARKPQPSLDANQLTSLSAMIAYSAHKTGQSEFRVERNLADHFNIPNAKFLGAPHFDTAIRYLADMIAA